MSHAKDPIDPPVLLRKNPDLISRLLTSRCHRLDGTKMETPSWISSELQAKKEYHPNPPRTHPQLYPERISPEYLDSVLGNYPPCDS